MVYAKPFKGKMPPVPGAKPEKSCDECRYKDDNYCKGCKNNSESADEAANGGSIHGTSSAPEQQPIVFSQETVEMMVDKLIEQFSKFVYETGSLETRELIRKGHRVYVLSLLQSCGFERQRLTSHLELKALEKAKKQAYQEGIEKGKAEKEKEIFLGSTNTYELGRQAGIAALVKEIEKIKFGHINDLGEVMKAIAAARQGKVKA